MVTDSEVATALELHARLLAEGGAAAADALARSASAEAAGLMDLAARVFQALPQVPPDPAFRAGLEDGLAAAAALAARPLRRGERWRRAGRALGRHPALAALAGGAALAALGLTLVWLAGRGSRPLPG